MIKAQSFKFKLALSYILVIVIPLAFVFAFLARNLEENALRDIKNSLVNQAYLIESKISSDNLSKEDVGYLSSLVNELSQKIQCRITIINKQGKVLADSGKNIDEVFEMDNHAKRPEVREALFGNIGDETRYSTTLKKEMLYLALPVRDGNQIIGAVRLALPLTAVETMLSVIRNAILFSFIFALGLAFVVGSLLTAGITRPINKIIHISRRFSKGDFRHKIYIDSKDEIGELASNLNTMAQDMEDKIKAVNTHHQHLRAILDSMVEGVIVIDKSGKVTSVNPTVEKIFDTGAKDIEGRNFLEAIRNNDMAEIIDAVLQNGTPVSKELKLVFPVQKIFQINASPIFENNLVHGCVLVIHDTTEMHRLETVRRDFVANLSHELKTPLTSIKGFIETLLGGALEDKQNSRSFLQIVQDHTDRLAHLINDLLTLSYLESSFAKLTKETINLKELVDKIISGMKAALKKDTVSVSNDLSDRLTIRADRHKIEQVLVNLIDNAIKFNKDKGNIRIYSQEANSAIKVFVEDSGMGIPEKDVPRIFERFYRVDKARSRELGGTGLGLSIVKHIVELHGGSVGVESTEGLGSTFWFVLPLEK